jgi:type I pantothenate kinase
LSTPSAFITLTRAEWEAHGGGGQPSGPRPGRDRLIPADEVQAIYAPFSRLLGGRLTKGETFRLGVGGAVSVGKSTTAELLKALLGEYHDVGLLSTDGFLLLPFANLPEAIPAPFITISPA